MEAEYLYGVSLTISELMNEGTPLTPDDMQTQSTRWGERGWMDGGVFIEPKGASSCPIFMYEWNLYYLKHWIHIDQL